MKKHQSITPSTLHLFWITYDQTNTDISSPFHCLFKEFFALITHNSLIFLYQIQNLPLNLKLNFKLKLQHASWGS